MTKQRKIAFLTILSVVSIGFVFAVLGKMDIRSKPVYKDPKTVWCKHIGIEYDKCEYTIEKNKRAYAVAQIGTDARTYIKAAILRGEFNEDTIDKYEFKDYSHMRTGLSGTGEDTYHYTLSNRIEGAETEKTDLIFLLPEPYHDVCIFHSNYNNQNLNKHFDYPNGFIKKIDNNLSTRSYRDGDDFNGGEIPDFDRYPKGCIQTLDGTIYYYQLIYAR